MPSLSAAVFVALVLLQATLLSAPASAFAFRSLAGQRSPSSEASPLHGLQHPPAAPIFHADHAVLTLGSSVAAAQPPQNWEGLSRGGTLSLLRDWVSRRWRRVLDAPLPVAAPTTLEALGAHVAATLAGEDEAALWQLLHDLQLGGPVDAPPAAAGGGAFRSLQQHQAASTAARARRLQGFYNGFSAGGCGEGVYVDSTASIFFSSTSLPQTATRFCSLGTYHVEAIKTLTCTNRDCTGNCRSDCNCNYLGCDCTCAGCRPVQGPGYGCSVSCSPGACSVLYNVYCNYGCHDQCGLWATSSMSPQPACRAACPPFRSGTMTFKCNECTTSPSTRVGSSYVNKTFPNAAWTPSSSNPYEGFFMCSAGFYATPAYWACDNTDAVGWAGASLSCATCAGYSNPALSSCSTNFSAPNLPVASCRCAPGTYGPASTTAVCQRDTGWALTSPLKCKPCGSPSYVGATCTSVSGSQISASCTCAAGFSGSPFTARCDDVAGWVANNTCVSCAVVPLVGATCAVTNQTTGSSALCSCNAGYYTTSAAVNITGTCVPSGWSLSGTCSRCSDVELSDLLPASNCTLSAVQDSASCSCQPGYRTTTGVATFTATCLRANTHWKGTNTSTCVSCGAASYAGATCSSLAPGASNCSCSPGYYGPKFVVSCSVASGWPVSAAAGSNCTACGPPTIANGTCDNPADAYTPTRNCTCAAGFRPSNGSRVVGTCDTVTGWRFSDVCVPCGDPPAFPGGSCFATAGANGACACTTPGWTGTSASITCSNIVGGWDLTPAYAKCKPCGAPPRNGTVCTPPDPANPAFVTCTCDGGYYSIDGAIAYDGYMTRNGSFNPLAAALNATCDAISGWGAYSGSGCAKCVEPPRPTGATVDYLSLAPDGSGAPYVINYTCPAGLWPATVVRVCDQGTGQWSGLNFTACAQPSPTPTVTPSSTATPSETPSVTSSLGAASQSITATSSRTGSRFPTRSPTKSATQSTSASPSLTGSASVTPTLSATGIVAAGGSPSTSLTASATPSPATPSVTPSVTPSPSGSPSLTPSLGPTNSLTPTASITPTQTRTSLGTVTVTPSGSSSTVQSPTNTASVSASRSLSQTSTPSSSGSASPTQTGSGTPSVLSSVSVTSSLTPSPSKMPSVTSSLGAASPSLTTTPSRAATWSITKSATQSTSASPSLTGSASVTPTLGATGIVAAGGSPSTSLTASATPSPATPSVTPSVTPSNSGTPSLTPSLGAALQSIAAASSQAGSQLPTPTPTACVAPAAAASSSASVPTSPSFTPSLGPSPSPACLYNPAPGTFNMVSTAMLVSDQTLPSLTLWRLDLAKVENGTTPVCHIRRIVARLVGVEPTNVIVRLRTDAYFNETWSPGMPIDFTLNDCTCMPSMYALACTSGGPPPANAWDSGQNVIQRASVYSPKGTLLQINVILPVGMSTADASKRLLMLNAPALDAVCTSVPSQLLRLLQAIFHYSLPLGSVANYQAISNAASTVVVAGLDPGRAPSASPRPGQQPCFDALSLGGFHGLALSRGSVAAFGEAAAGQTDVPPATAGRALAVAAGGFFSCALHTVPGSSNNTTTVSCWGGGGGSSVVMSVPSSIASDGGVRALAAGGYHACAILANASAVCWGANGAGQVSPLPPAVSTSGVASLALGAYHSCAVLAGSGVVTCWGKDDAGQVSGVPPGLARGSGSGSLPPQVSCGGSHCCGWGPSTPLTCWGGNSAGQTSVPPAVAAASVIDACAGGYFSCAVMSGSVTCWGSSAKGKTAVLASARDGSVTSIACGWYGACALKSGGSFVCWGGDLGVQAAAVTGGGTMDVVIASADVTGSARSAATSSGSVVITSGTVAGGGTSGAVSIATGAATGANDASGAIVLATGTTASSNRGTISLLAPTVILEQSLAVGSNLTVGGATLTAADVQALVALLRGGGGTAATPPLAASPPAASG